MPKSFEKFLYLLLMPLMTMPCVLRAQGVSIPVETQAWYYEIGGAEPVSAPLNPAPKSKPLNLSASLSPGYSCGNFDITATVSNLFNNIGSSLENTLMSAAQGAIGSLPLYIFQRALPGLYEMFQTYAAKFQVMFGDALKTCEQYEQIIIARNDPFAAWRQMAKAENWRFQMTTGNDSIVAKLQVEQDGGNKGATWIGGKKAGGTGQPPIEPVRDVTEAGWNTALNRNPDDSSPYTGPDVRLVELFSTPASAGAYAVDVLGDMRAPVCDTCTSQAVPGHGLLPKYEMARTAVATDLTTVIGAAGVPRFVDLQNISSANVGISAEIIETLRELPPDERGIMAGRLASEVAVARTIEQALAVRRLLLGGRRVPEVTSHAPALEIIDTALDELEREIDTFLYEQRIRKEIATNTAGAIIARRNQLQGEGADTGRAPRPEGVHLDEGGRFR